MRSLVGLVITTLLLVACPPPGGGYGEDDTGPGTEANLGRGEVAVDPRTDTAFALTSELSGDCHEALRVESIRAGAEQATLLAQLGYRWQPRMFFTARSVALLGGMRGGANAQLELYDPHTLERTGRYTLEDAWPSGIVLDDGGRLLAATIPKAPTAAPEPESEPLAPVEGAEPPEQGRADGGPAGAVVDEGGCARPLAVPAGPQRALFLLDTERLERVNVEVSADGMRLAWRTGHHELLVVAEDAPTVAAEARLRVLSYRIEPEAPPPDDEPPALALSTTDLPYGVRFVETLDGLRIARTTLQPSRARLVSDESGRFSALPVERFTGGREKHASGASEHVEPAVLVVDHALRRATVVRDVYGPVGFVAGGELVGWQVRPTDDPRAKRRPALQLVALDVAEGARTRGFEAFVMGTPSLALLPGSSRALVGSSGFAAPLSVVDVESGAVTRVAGEHGDLAPYVFDRERDAVWLLAHGLVRVDLERGGARTSWQPFYATSLSLLPGRGELVLRHGLEREVHFLAPDDVVFGSERGAARARSVKLFGWRPPDVDEGEGEGDGGVDGGE